MVNDKKTYSDKEIYDALKMIRDICKNSEQCKGCKLSYNDRGIPLCDVGKLPRKWNFTELPGEWKPFEKEETHGYK